jgi:alpha-L-arabinofuranosidase
VVSVLADNKPLAGLDSLYGSATIDKKTNEVILKFVNAGGIPQNRNIELNGVRKINTDASLILLKASDLADINSIEDPTSVKPVEQKMKLRGKTFSLPLAPYSFTILKIKMY